MKTRGTSGATALISFVLAGCGAAPTPPRTSATTTSQAEAPKTVIPVAPTVATEPAPEPASAAPAPVEAAEPCAQDWVCLRVPFDAKGKIEKRATRLLGDPKIETTWSQNIDSSRPAKFDASKPVEISVRHPPSRPGQHLAHVFLKANGRDILIDKHENEEFSFVAVIAAEKEGDNALLVDIRYMK